MSGLQLVACLALTFIAVHSSTSAYDPQLQVDEAGNSVFGYSVVDESNRQWTTRDQANSGDLSAPTSLSRVGWRVWDARLLTDAAGNTTATWIESDANDSRMVLFAAQKSAQVPGWINECPLSDEGTQVVYSYSFAASGTGHWIVVYRLSNRAVYERHALFGQPWSVATLLT